MMKDSVRRSIDRLIYRAEEVESVLPILTLCLEQIQEQPDDLLVRLTWMIEQVHSIFCLAKDDIRYGAKLAEELLEKLSESNQNS